MPDFTLVPENPLAGVDKTYGATRLTAVVDVAIVSVALPLGHEDAALNKLKKLFGTAFPEAGYSAIGNDSVRLLRLSSDQGMVLFKHTTHDSDKRMQEYLGEAVYTTAQSDNWVALDLAGPGASAALERLCSLDLHDNAFPVGRIARTVMEHLGVILIRTGKQEWRLLSASSSAGSFVHALEVSLKNTL